MEAQPQDQEKQQQYFLGIDVSTQSLKMQVIDSNHNKVYSNKVLYKDILNGEPEVNISEDKTNSNSSVTAEQNVYLFLAALETALKDLSEQFCKKITALAVSGQQHGSVYFLAKEIILEDESQDLVNLFKDSFSTNFCPIWMDSSTSNQCEQIEKICPQLMSLTGSRAFQRFTLSQILKKAQLQKNIFEKTHHISLISSFITEVFAGKFLGIDIGDASGMNLMDLRTKQYIPALLDSIPSLRERLGDYDPVVSWKTAGNVAEYFQKRYPKIFNNLTKVIYGTGDNLASMVGIGLLSSENLAISFGTSDTLFGLIEEKSLEVTINKNLSVFASPLDPQQYVVLLCQKNGGLLRESLLAESNLSWNELEDFYFNSYTRKGFYGVFLSLPEIVPSINAALREIRCLPKNSNTIIPDPSAEALSPAEKVILAIEYKLMSLKINYKRTGCTIRRLILTGGGASNRIIRDIAAHVFDCSVYVQSSDDSAAIGSALRSYHGYLCESSQEKVDFQSVFKESPIYAWKETNKPNNVELQRYFENILVPLEILEQQLQQKYQY